MHEVKVDTRSLLAAVDAQGFSKSELAHRSGVSRGAVYGLFRDPDKEVRESTVQRLAAALDVSPESLFRGGALNSYLDWVGNQQREVDFGGLGIGQLQPIALDDLYVPTKLTMDMADRNECEDEREPVLARKARVRAAEPVEFEQAVELHDRMVLVGGPGSGKTTLLRHLASAWAKAGRHAGDSGDQAGTPVFVRLAEYAKATEEAPGLDLVAFVAAAVRQEERVDPDQLLRERLERGRCVVLLDGLDEVGNGKRLDEVSRSVRRFVRQYPRNRFVITARRIGLDREPWRRLGFAEQGVVPWGPDQIKRFIEKWAELNTRQASAHARAAGQERAEQLFRLICRNPRIRDIATNPLMLVILTRLHHDHGVLPHRRADLYGKVVDTLLESWETAKFAALPGDRLYGTLLEGREYGWLLAYLALKMQQNDLTIAAGWWVTDQIRRFLHEQLGFELDQAKDESDRVLRYIVERSGLLAERGQGMFGFWHLTFQEYFAAQSILHEAASQPSRGLNQILRQYFYHPRWTQVIRLVASQLTPGQTPALLRSILDDPDPTGRFLHRGPLLALRCLSDGTAVAESRLLDQIFSGVQDLGKSKWLGITLDALHILRSFEGTRFAARAEETIESILRFAEQHLSEDERVQLHKAGDQALQEQIARVLSEHRAKHPGLGASVTIDFEGNPIPFRYLDPQLRASEPEKWYTRASKLLRSKDTDEFFQRALISVLRDAAFRAPRARDILVELLVNSPDEKVREGCAWALGNVAATDPDLRTTLLNRFKEDRSGAVRGACAVSLRDIVADDKAVRDALLRTLTSGKASVLRAGAAGGLAKAARADGAVRQALVKVVSAKSNDEKLRVSCCWSLQRCLDADEAARNAVLGLLDEESAPRLRGVASQVLARSLAGGRIPWDRHLVEAVEKNLMELTNPCPHALAALQQIVDAREIRAGLRLERVLADSLEEVEGDIEIAFVYGSTAQLAQNTDSDVDLFVVGDTTLKQLSGPLDHAQTTLGRQINPVIYDPSTLTERYHAGNPFLQDVLRREKIFLKGDENGLRDMVATPPASAGDRRDPATVRSR